MIIRRAISVIVGSVVLAAAGCSPGTLFTPTPPIGAPAGTPPAGTAASSGPAAERPQVPAIAACALLTADEVWDAFGFDIGGQFTFERGEACAWEIDVDGDIRGRVRIEPGAPEDFEPGASIGALSNGERESGVGAAAYWFSGQSSGALSVVQETTFGYQFFRLLMDSADHDAAALKELALDLAAKAAPRFPGAQAQAVTFDRQPPDVPSASLVDNILSKEQAGEWSRAEGLIATLRLLADEIDAAQVLPATDLVDRSATGVIDMAREFVEQDGDAAAQAEIARLLDYLVFTRTELEAMTADQRLAAVGGNFGQDGRATLQGGEEQCAVFNAAGPCLEEWVSTELDAMFGVGKYRMFTLAGELGAKAGWTDQPYFWAMDAMVRSAKAYEALGEMPPRVSVTLWPWDAAAYSATNDAADECLVEIYPPALDLLEGQFKQWIAGELAHCFIAATFPGREAGYEVWRWWNHALAVYLSNVVYPAPDCGGSRCDLEWATLPVLLSERELATTLLDRSTDNWLFFQHLGATVGDDGIIELVASLPSGGDKAAHQSALAGYGAMAELLHGFARGLTDASIPDTGGGVVPYDPESWAITVSGPQHVLENPPPFGISRINLVVEGANTACLDYSSEGDVRWSSRPGEPGVAGAWNTELPRTLSGQAVFVATTMRDGAQVEITVTDVVDDPADCDEGGSPLSGEGCLEICPPSNYYEFKEQLEEWFRRIVGS